MANNDQDIAIIGLGSFGINVLNNFVSKGVDVTIIDKSQDLINKYGNKSSNAIVLDSTNSEALKSVGINNYDHVVVAIGQDLNASILTTLVLLELGVKNIVVKASDENHVKILKKIGAHRIVYPDSEMGKRVSMQIMHRSLIELVQLNENQTMVQVRVTNAKFSGKDLASLDITNNYGVIIAGIRRGDEIKTPRATEVLLKDDLLIIVGDTAKVEQLTDII